MNAAKPKNLKKLVDATWLVSQGIVYESFRDYVKRGWLERIKRGVFRRPLPNTPATPTSNGLGWKTCILSTQHIMGHDLQVGGSTSLGKHAHTHYLRLSESAPVLAYRDNIPTWLVKLP